MKRQQTKKSLSLLFFLFFAGFSFFFNSCDLVFELIDEFDTPTRPAVNSGKPADSGGNNFDCPPEIAASAFEYAKLYAAADTTYVYGGQDPLRAIGIDCSGLVIMCYTYALKGSGYKLLQSDMSSSYIYKHAASLTSSPRHGDLIFMGDDSNDPSVYHIAIFDRFEGDQVYFIDSTSQGKINGVSKRHYSRSSKKIKAYGIMKLKN